MCCLRLLFLDTAGDELCQQILASSFFEVCLGGQVVAPDPSIEVSEDFFIHRAPFPDLLENSGQVERRNTASVVGASSRNVNIGVACNA